MLTKKGNSIALFAVKFPAEGIALVIWLDVVQKLMFIKFLYNSINTVRTKIKIQINYEIRLQK